MHNIAITSKMTFFYETNLMNADIFLDYVFRASIVSKEHQMTTGKIGEQQQQYKC